MSATTCPFCNALVNFTSQWSDASIPPILHFGSAHGRRITVQKCSNENCQMFVLMVMQNNDIMGMWPKTVGGKAFPEVPEHIAEAANEAYECYSIQSYRAATLLARSVIEATAKEKGVTQGSLMKKIDDMHTQGLIREFVRDGAHEVRYLGNDMAHGDFVAPVAEAEAELALSLMDEVLDEIFQAPARVAAARARRLQKSGA